MHVRKLLSEKRTKYENICIQDIHGVVFNAMKIHHHTPEAEAEEEDDDEDEVTLHESFAKCKLLLNKE